MVLKVIGPFIDVWKNELWIEYGLWIGYGLDLVLELSPSAPLHTTNFLLYPYIKMYPATCTTYGTHLLWP